MATCAKVSSLGPMQDRDVAFTFETYQRVSLIWSRIGPNSMFVFFLAGSTIDDSLQTDSKIMC